VAKSFAVFVFLKEVKEELEKVSWPKRDEAIRLTGIVVLVSILVGIFIAFWDFVFTKIIQFILTK